ncbi:uncharacterized protein BX663DRAFT_492806 [Cokeromyces recurvatus]|uniref:uncharacterized protein n=1 Tax=Cokeromyces recurvatus TaxID=90255 RepID=UPI00221E97B0|nr:uncharacterized protein BX663DRAFT_492806 [Cokeromyces recurvatus]KAI7908045.1 hypothetical protein BX663DRAFT_492806 [Cokeromyces recurvatus]
MSFPATTFFLTAAYIVFLISSSERHEFLTITYPVEGVVFKAGDQLVLSWDNLFDENIILEIVLIYDDSLNKEKKNMGNSKREKVVANNVNANKLHYMWDIPLDTIIIVLDIIEFRSSLTQTLRSKYFTIEGVSDM